MERVRAARFVADTSEALLAACPPGAETRRPALYVKARADGDRSMRMEAFDVMVTGAWELATEVWQETELVLWKPPTAWPSIKPSTQARWRAPRLPRPAKGAERSAPAGG